MPPRPRQIVPGEVQCSGDAGDIPSAALRVAESVKWRAAARWFGIEI